MLEELVKMDAKEILKAAYERLDLDVSPAERVLAVSGGESSYLDALTVDQLNVKPHLEFLRDYLMLFAPASEIIRMHRDEPEKLLARAIDCDGKCEDCDHRDAGACSSKES